jgi:hypothetical protein
MQRGKAECVACAVAESCVRRFNENLKGDQGNCDSKSPELLSTLVEARGK